MFETASFSNSSNVSSIKQKQQPNLIIDRMKKLVRILTVTVFTIMLLQNCQKSDFIVLTGIVTDSLTNKPIEGAYIWANGQDYRTASDGSFLINGVLPGKQSIYVYSFNGHRAKTKSILVSEGRVNRVEFSLSPIKISEIETGTVQYIALTSANITGNIKLNSNEYVERYGHCWSSSSSIPTLEESEGSASSYGGFSSEINFTSTLSGLSIDKIYYVRAFAQTRYGISYGNTVIFRTGDIKVSKGLVTFFPFSGTYNDITGAAAYSYGWALNYTADRKGAANNALSLNSTLFYAYSFNEAFYTFQDFSVSFWFYKNSWSGVNSTMVCAGYPNYINEFRISEDGTAQKIFFDIKTNNGTYKVSALTAPSLGAWHHVVALRSGTALKLYIDGELQGSVPCDNQVISTEYNNWGYSYLFAGTDLNWPYNYFEGSLDDIRVYNRALTNSEIIDLFKD